ncbi:hypothetical protein FQA39_LY15960 [Lamprigera yunnana]|nr:hypothetical protein FQA39_LY15960 [Lamprigera yunnana]
MYIKLMLFVSVLTFFQVCDSAKILAIVPSASYSHQVAFRSIWRELSLRGHQITLATTDPINDPKLVNLTEIDLSYSYKIWNKNLKEVTQSNIIKSMLLMVEAIHTIGEYQLAHPLVQELIKNDQQTFDLVMVEFSMGAYFAFGYRFNCPTIFVTSINIMNSLSYYIGNPNHPIVYPELFYPNTETVMDRVIVILYEIFMYCLNIFYITPTQQKLIYKHFGADYPPFQDMAFNASLVLTNSDPVFHKIRPLVPSVIQIGGGAYREPGKPLPKDLKDTLDSAKEGFIYFSLGSNVKSKDLSEQTRNVILETFRELPYTVLWKFELDDLPNKPKNVITSKWLSQARVLSHPNVKLFITQGGLQSMEEAIYNHVPFLVMPFFGDQELNSKKIVQKGFGLSVDYKTLTKEHFMENILEVINNPKYKNRVKELADLASDEPMNGIEKAVWWTEYVIRHKGARHLRSPLLDIPTYQYYLLDVIAVFAVIVVVIVCLFIIVLKFVAKVIFKKSKVKVS